MIFFSGVKNNDPRIIEGKQKTKFNFEKIRSENRPFMNDGTEKDPNTPPSEIDTEKI